MRPLKELLDSSSEEIFKFLKDDVLPDATSVIWDEQIEEQRARMERLGAYLPRLRVNLLALKEFMDGARADWLKKNPKPTGTVNEWKEQYTLKFSAYLRMIELLTGLIEDIGQKITVTQSILKSHSREG